MPNDSTSPRGATPVVIDATMHPHRHRDVPYFTQWGSPAWVARIVEEDADPCGDPAWQKSGFTDPERYRFWAQRLCGLTCLESALDFWQIAHPARAALLDTALERGVYVMREDGGVDGLIYRPFAQWIAQAFPVDVDVHVEAPVEALAACIDSRSMAIASVSPEIRYPQRANERRGGHLVLLHGWDREGVWFHNPSGIGDTQADAYLPFDVFSRFYAGRGMVLKRR